MSERDPVSWEEIEATTGPPTATGVESDVEAHRHDREKSGWKHHSS
jgi:hypothetical protein